MSWSPIVLIEVVLVFGTVLGWGLWQLWDLRRDRRDTQRAPADSDSTDRGG